MQGTTVDLDCELDSYITTALWASDRWDLEGTGVASPLEDHFDASDLAPETRESMRADLARFVATADPDALAFWKAELGGEQIGHDFWLTRNGHGTGFWDRFRDGAGEAFGRHLTELAQSFGESYLYEGDDGRLYVD